MPVDDYIGDTFVAFADITGFKEMMKDGKKAVLALDKLNQTGYKALHNNDDINGFFVSDCGILFVRSDNLSKQEKLKRLLLVIKKINKELLKKDIMLTTSIAYGKFSYHQRIEFPGIEKNPIYGNAYVAAFLDNETGKPKIQPGQCRIIIRNLLDADITGIDCLKKKKDHYYYYWMVENKNDITAFERQYNDAYKLKYQGMINALKRNSYRTNALEGTR